MDPILGELNLKVDQLDYYPEAAESNYPWQNMISLWSVAVFSPGLGIGGVFPSNFPINICMLSFKRAVSLAHLTLLISLP
jgi:hypothetical protein